MGTKHDLGRQTSFWGKSKYLSAKCWTVKENRVSLVVKNLPLLEEEMATHFHILAWESPWTEEPGGLQFMGSQRTTEWLSKHACTQDDDGGQGRPLTRVYGHCCHFRITQEETCSRAIAKHRAWDVRALDSHSPDINKTLFRERREDTSHFAKKIIPRK